MLSTLSLFATFTVVLVAIALYPLGSSLYRVGHLFHDVSDYGMENCQLVQATGLNSCEDMAIHYPSSLAFLSCRNMLQRSQQAAVGQDANTPVVETSTIYLYNLKTDTSHPLTLVGFDSELNTLGISVVDSSEKPGKLVVMLVNRSTKPGRVEIFEYQLPDPTQASTDQTLSNTLEHRETVHHSLLTHPNGLYAVSDQAFYVSNDCHYHSGLMQKLEMFTQRPWSNVVFRNEDGIIRQAARGLVFANGIVFNHDHSLAFIASSTTGTVGVYRVTPAGTLHLSETISLDFMPDNLTLDPVHGHIYVTGVVKFLEATKFLKAPSLDTTTKAGFKVARIVNNTASNRFLGVNFAYETVLVDSGKVLPLGSVAAVDPRSNKLYASSVVSPGVLVCQLPS
ncbi:hypothetical protein IWQ62_001264 [Dispira parvispora]|uniref:Calcium-dependent phosphotriesterase n=1 Tax=Dispira parvispora TaxID=1520584 RepID=A0A9W8AU08_9FUNG|nr:hypothetical protein IWQ62_001264 [Dispira parvispora]